MRQKNYLNMKAQQIDEYKMHNRCCPGRRALVEQGKIIGKDVVKPLPNS